MGKTVDSKAFSRFCRRIKMIKTPLDLDTIDSQKHIHTTYKKWIDERNPDFIESPPAESTEYESIIRQFYGKLGRDRDNRIWCESCQFHKLLNGENAPDIKLFPILKRYINSFQVESGNYWNDKQLKMMLELEDLPSGKWEVYFAKMAIASYRDGQKQATNEDLEDVTKQGKPDSE